MARGRRAAVRGRAEHEGLSVCLSVCPCSWLSPSLLLISFTFVNVVKQINSGLLFLSSFTITEQPRCEWVKNDR